MHTLVEETDVKRDNFNYQTSYAINDIKVVYISKKIWGLHCKEA